MKKINANIVVILLLLSLLLTLPAWQLVPSGQAQPAQPLTLHSEKPLEPIHMHCVNPGIIDPMNPYQTVWHELYPQFCQMFTLTSWEDNGNDILDTSDQIDMEETISGDIHWYHVDRVTFTLFITAEQAPEYMYIEFKGPYDPIFLENPECTLWHEVWPVYCPIYHIVDWMDSGEPYGQLSYCDWIQFEDGSWWHVEEVATDLILNEKISEPVCTYWNELHPTFGNRYHIIEWLDENQDFILSPSDKVTLDPGPIMPYTVTDVTLTLNITLKGDPEQRMYIEFTGGFRYMWEPKTIPIGTWWHEVYPEYCPMFQIGDWVDNCNGVLSYCDNITLLDMTGHPTDWHVEELSIDIIVQEPVHDVSVISVTPLFGSVFQGWPCPINVAVSNDGDFTESFDVDVKYNGTHVTTSPITVSNLPPQTSQKLTFCWVTKNVPLGTYTINAYAHPVTGETELGDNNMTDGTVTILAPPPFYWKEGFCDYAPSGVPDFDQKQWGTYNWTDKWGAWSHCGPVAVANSIWWLDSEFEPAQPPKTPPTISDGFPLVSSYIPGLDDHDPANVQPLVEHLAYLMDTDGRRTGLAHSGTYVNDMEAGLSQYLSWTGVNPKGDVNGDGVVNQTDVDIVNAAMGSTPISGNWNMAADIYPVTLGWPNKGVADNKVNQSDLDLVNANLGNTSGYFYEHTVDRPDFYYIEEEVEKCQDVVLLLGYWILIIPPEGEPYWYREGGHYVTVAGVNSEELKIAISDPCYDAFENQLIPEGRVPIPHAHGIEPPYVTHNDAAYVSHDIYNVSLISQIVPIPPLPPCPGGNWTLINYVGWQPTPFYFTVIESAVITSPQGVHDINITSLTTHKTVVAKGKNLNITATILNEGTFTETFNVIFYANTTTIGTKTVNNLAPGNNVNATLVWNTSGFSRAWIISANATILPGETDIADNTRTYGIIKVSCLGDINGDYVTDITDYQLVKGAIPSTPGSKKWKPNADMNDDLIIDITDYQIVKAHIPSVDP